MNFSKRATGMVYWRWRGRLHIFLSSLASLVRTGLSAKDALVNGSDGAKTGAAVPPEGPLMRLLSVMI